MFPESTKALYSINIYEAMTTLMHTVRPTIQEMLGPRKIACPQPELAERIFRQTTAFYVKCENTIPR